MHHFNWLINLPARVFYEMLDSDDLNVTEEIQVINLIANYTRSILEHIEEKKKVEAQHNLHQI